MKSVPLYLRLVPLLIVISGVVLLSKVHFNINRIGISS